MGTYDYYKSGSWNFICEVCGRKFKANQMKKRWDGAIVCREDWEPRHPQDFVRGVKDNPSVPLSRPEGTDTFIPWNFTENITEVITTSDNTAKAFTKYFGTLQTTSTTPINGEALNLDALNVTGVTGYNGDTITSSDSVSRSTTKVFSDTITTSEFVVVQLSSSSSLNGAALNTISLG